MALLHRCTAEASSLQLPVAREGPAGCAAFLREAGACGAARQLVTVMACDDGSVQLALPSQKRLFFPLGLA